MLLNKFEKFTETIYYKNYNESDKKIDALKQLQKIYPDNEKISKTLKFCELGLKGEKDIEYELKNANIGLYVLHDVNLEFNNSRAQIDYIIITPAYIYFIECKNLIGNISVSSNGQFVREYSYNNKIIKEAIYSPLTQAQRHIDIFKKIWNLNHNTFLDNFLDKFFNVNIDNILKPLVVMANSKNILNLKEAPEDIKNKIIRVDGLVNYIKKDISSYDKNLLLSKEKMEKNANGIMERYNNNININYKEYFEEKLVSEEERNELKVKNREKVKEKLLQFREKKHKKMNVSAFYIFNNEELELILDKMPKTIDELESLNIIQKIKVKCHGKEIIDIINGLSE